MTPTSDPSSDPEFSEDSPNLTPRSSRKQKWVPTKAALDKFLEELSPDREEAGKNYEILRIKLLRYFEWRGCELADLRTDMTFDRAMRKLDEGQEISNLIGYVFGIAKLVAKEEIKSRERLCSLDDEIRPPTTNPLKLEPDDAERRLICFDRCMETLPDDGRDLIMSYYQDDVRTKIDQRKQLAAKLGIQLNALRIRAHRIRKTLEECIHECLGQHA